MFIRSRRSMLALLGLWLLAACAGSQPTASAPLQPLRAMSFNIRYGTARDSINSWPLRRALTFRVIRDFAPTVLGVQEALRFQLDEIEQQMAHYGRIGVGRDDGVEAGEYSAILYDRRRLDVLEQGTFWLSDTPTIPGSKSWGNNITRIVTWARFSERDVANSTFYVFNTHWDHESQPARERSAGLLLERIRTRTAQSDAVIVMGDFNSGESNPAFKALLAGSIDGSGAKLTDTFRVLHPRAASVGTYHAFKGNRSGEKIDAILVSPEWRTLAADIVLYRDGDVYPSDHFPVTAIVQLGKAAR